MVGEVDEEARGGEGKERRVSDLDVINALDACAVHVGAACATGATSLPFLSAHKFSDLSTERRRLLSVALACFARFRLHFHSYRTHHGLDPSTSMQSPCSLLEETLALAQSTRKPCHHLMQLSDDACILVFELLAEEMLSFEVLSAWISKALSLFPEV
jgi:hypothetical protein